MTESSTDQTNQRSASRWLVIILLIAVTAATAWFLFDRFSPSGKKARLSERADAYYKQGEYDKARIEYLSLLALEPKHSLAVQRLGVILYDGGAIVQSFRYLKTGRELAPDNLDLGVKYASALIAAGRLPDARKELADILRRDPRNGDGLLLFIELSNSPAEIAEAEQHLKSLSEPKSAAALLGSGLLALKRQDVPAAEAAITQAIKLDQSSYSAHLGLASVYSLKKEGSKAVEQIKIAAGLAPLRSNARIKYAETLGQAGEFQEARRFVGEITAKAPDYIPAWIFLAQLAFSEQKADEVSALLQNVFTRDSNNYEGRLIEAQVQLAKGETPKAIAMLEQLLKLYPSGHAARLSLARAHIRSGNSTKAAGELKELLSRNPDNVSGALLLAELDVRAGNNGIAILALLDLLKKHPRLSPAKLLLAEAYRATGRLEDAAIVFREEIQTTPTSGAHFFLGRILTQQGKLSEAQAAFEKALELAPENIPALDQLVELDLKQKNFAAARSRVERLAQKQPGSADARFFEGKILIAQRDPDAAEKALIGALELNPNLLAAYALLINSYLEGNKLDAARKQIEAVLAKDPRNIHMRTLLGMASESLKDFSLAQQSYEKALEVNPRFVVALNNLACLYSEHLNKLDRALELARQARVLQPSDPSIADTLGWILHRRGEYQEALVLIKEAADKRTDSAEIKYHLGMTFYMMGNKDAARSALREAAAAKNDFPGKAGIAAQLKLLGDDAANAGSRSVAEIEAMIKDQPADPNLRVLLAEAYEKQRDIPKAIAACDEALRLNPKLVSPLIVLGRLHLAAQNPAKALETAKKARALAPTDAKVGGALGYIALQAGDFAWSHSLLQEAAQEFPGDAEVAYDSACAAYYIGKIEQARTRMQKLVQQPLDPARLKAVQTFLAMDALLQQPPGDPAAAAGKAQAVLAENPEHLPALMVRAAVEAALGDRTASVATCAKMLAKYPAFAPAQKQLAALYLDDPASRAKAYDLATAARREMPADTTLTQILAEAACERREFKFALQLFDEVAAKAALNARGKYFLGVCHLQLGDKQKAFAAITDSLAAGLAEPFASEARSRIAELEKK